MSENDDKKTLEKFTLLPNRYYIILEKVDESILENQNPYQFVST